MSIKYNIQSLPDTKQNFDSNTMMYIEGAFLSPKGFTIAYANRGDLTVWQQALKDGNLTPLHNLLEKEDNNTEETYNESILGFTYLSDQGEYKNKLNYNLDLEKHKALDAISGADLDIWYYDYNRNFYCTTDDNKTTIRGFSSERIALDKLSLATTQAPALTIIDVELKDSDELNKRGVVENFGISPTAIDRLYASIDILYIDASTINFTAKYKGEDLNDIEASGVTVIDNVNGELPFSYFNYLGGVYRMTFNTPTNPITGGSIKIISDIYLACVNYVNTSETYVTVNYDFENGDNYDFEDGTNFDFN